MITIIDYGLGNLRSIENMLRSSGIEAVISSDRDLIAKANKLILPGVGHFRYGMQHLKESGLVGLLEDLVLTEGRPILGICLGAQMLGRSSEEGCIAGLGWLEMDTIAFDPSRLAAEERIPHMGWAETMHNNSHPLFEGLSEPARFYYVHSFHFRCDDPAMVICTASHGYSFPSGVAKGHIVGVQFHPEKSHAFGRRLLMNFAKFQFL